MKTALLLASLVVFSSLGELFSARAMKQIGDVEFRFRAILQTIWRAMRNRSLWLAILFLATSFFSFLSLLSYADLSFVIPLTAITYLTNTVGARFLLREKISAARWMGTLLVTLGVSIISLPRSFESSLIAAAKHIFVYLLSALSPQGSVISRTASLADWLMFSLRLALLICIISAIVYYLISIVAGMLWSRNRRAQRALGTNFTPAVSILIPVRGADEHTYENFAGFCCQDYPQTQTKLQLIFGVREESDPAVSIIRKLQHDFPALPIDLVISDFEIGTNAKVSNLHNMSAQIRHDVIVMADSDIRVGTDYLRRVIAPLQLPEVGLVTCLYRGSHAQTLAALLENIGISSTFSAEVVTARMLEGIRFALGSTIVVRRELLHEIGGFPALANHLADDFLLGNKAAATGCKIILSDYIVEHLSGRETLRTMLHHQLRWGRSVYISRTKGYAGLILTYGTATCLLFFLATGFSRFGGYTLGLTLLIRLITAGYFGVVQIGDKALARNFLLIPLRDLMGFGVWLMSFFGSTVTWRGAQYRVFRDGTIRPVTSRNARQSKHKSGIQPSA
jgi:ceramide glucosyltransferase